MLNPLKLFKKKEKLKEQDENSEGDSEGDEDEEVSEKKKRAEETKESGGNSSGELIKLSTELDRVKASVESFGEVRKATSERLNGLGEQIGELRAMILDRDRNIQGIELKAVKAADLVESVQPDKLMIEIQKGDAKFEALKANIEGNEAIMERIMDELKEMRKRMDFFRGVNEIVKLAEEVKKELIEIKKVEAVINVNADKIETIYSELRKRFQDIDLFKDSLQELKINLEQNTKDVDSVKTKIIALASREDLDKLVKKVQRYVDALQELDKTSALSRDVSRLKSMLEGLK